MQSFQITLEYQKLSGDFFKEERNSLCVSYDVKLYRAFHLVSLKNIENFIKLELITIEI